MINRDALRGAMVTAGYSTLKQGAKAIGMPVSTMYRKFNEGKFDSDEMEAMIQAYHIEKPTPIFFADVVN